VLKPSDEGGSMFVTRVDDEADLRRACDGLAAYRVNLRGQPREPLYLLEEYLPGEEISVEAVSFNGDVHIVGLTDKSVTGAPGFIEDGHMFPAAVEPGIAEAASDLVRRALLAVGYTHGVSHTEIKLTPAGPRIVEINPRTPGNSISELIRLVTGIDLLDVVIELALGNRPPLASQETGVQSAAVKLLLPSRSGQVTAVKGRDSAAALPGVVELSLKPVVGTHVERPQMNAYLGHVIAVDRVGAGARTQAERAAGQIALVFSDEPGGGEGQEAERPSAERPSPRGGAARNGPMAEVDV
jgi:biotin carboxylase